MNRKERRNVSRRLGIQQYQQKLSLAKRLNLLHENVIIGKQMEKENAEKVKLDITAQLEEKESQTVYHLAEDIAKVKKIAVIDAMGEAQKEFDNRRK
jgi:predicted amidophosphoribosyltransferase